MDPQIVYAHTMGYYLLRKEMNWELLGFAKWKKSDKRYSILYDAIFLMKIQKMYRHKNKVCGIW